VHLTGEADAFDVARTHGCLLQSLANGYSAGAPPVGRILLCPTGLRRRKSGVFLSARGYKPPVNVEKDSAGAASANVDAKEERNDGLRTN